MEDKTKKNKWCELAREFIPGANQCRIFRILEDTTNYYDVDYGDVVLLNNVGYLVKGTETEKKFGLEGESKPWVKSCIDLVTGAPKIIKLTFLEEFQCNIDDNKFTCLRNPEKEARILDKIRGKPGFMQGFHTTDSAGNNIRIMDKIRGMSLDNHIRSIQKSHEEYYFNYFPGIMEKFVGALRALAELHRLGEIHGDITPDHIYIEQDSGNYVWIDFDYDYRDYTELILRDVYELGIILSFIIGKEYVAYADLVARHHEVAEKITSGDMLMILRNQVANLKLVYPYIDRKINDVLCKFSLGAAERSGSVDQIADDIERALAF